MDALPGRGIGGGALLFPGETPPEGGVTNKFRLKAELPNFDKGWA